METLVSAVQPTKPKKFKSYYVVWKHSDIAFNLSALLRLNRTMQYGNAMSGWKFGMPLRMFKSYYVVWKQKSNIKKL